MALDGTAHVATGTAVQLSTLCPQNVKQIDIKANPANSANIYVGSSAVTAAGGAAWICLAPGESWSARSGGAGDQVDLGTAAYIIGTASDKAHISWI